MILEVNLNHDEVEDAIRYYIKTCHGVSIPPEGDVIVFQGEDRRLEAVYKVEIEE